MSKGDEHAFPHIVFENGATHLKGGLSKRELLAAMAMQGLLSAIYSDHAMLNEFTTGKDGGFMRHLSGREAVSKNAVSYADALLAELSKEPS